MFLDVLWNDNMLNSFSNLGARLISSKRWGLEVIQWIWLPFPFPVSRIREPSSRKRCRVLKWIQNASFTWEVCSWDVWNVADLCSSMFDNIKKHLHELFNLWLIHWRSSVANWVQTTPPSMNHALYYINKKEKGLIDTRVQFKRNFTFYEISVA